MKPELIKKAEKHILVITKKMDKIIERNSDDYSMNVKDIADLERYSAILSHLSKYLSEIYSW